MILEKKLEKKFKSKNITVLPVAKDHQSTMIYLKIDNENISYKQYYLIKTEEDGIVSGYADDSVNYNGNYFNDESEVIKDIEKWYKSHEEQIKTFSKLEKIYGKLTGNLTIGEIYGTAAIVPSESKYILNTKEAEKLAKKMKLDLGIEYFNDYISQYHFGNSDNLDGWPDINQYNSEFSVEVWGSPAGKLREISSDKVKSWDKPTTIFKKAVQELDKL